MNNTSFHDRVLQIVPLIPQGRVATYGQVALLAGVPGAAQAVGNILHNAAYTVDLPYQRVINKSGGLARGYTNGGVVRHKQDLEADGVPVRFDYTVDLKQYLWNPEKTVLDRLRLSPDLRIELAAKFSVNR